MTFKVSCHWNTFAKFQFRWGVMSGIVEGRKMICVKALCAVFEDCLHLHTSIFSFAATSVVIKSCWCATVLFSQIQNERCDKLWLGEMIVPLPVRQIIAVSKFTGCWHFFSERLRLLTSCCDRRVPVWKLSGGEPKSARGVGMFLRSLLASNSTAANTCVPGAAHRQ